MALNVTTLFTVIGKYVKTVNVFEGLLTTISTGQTDIETILESNNLTRLFANIPNLFGGYQSSIVRWISGTGSLISQIITDRDFVREQIPVAGNDLNSILLALIEYMNDQSPVQTVEKSVITVGAVGSNMAAGPTGDLIVGTLLDGVSAPIIGALSTREYRGLTSQMAPPDDDFYAQCVSKSSDGAEIWTIYTTAPGTRGFQIQNEAAGRGPTISTANSSPGRLSVANGEMETFTTTNVPDNWAMTGTVTTDYLESNTDLYVFRGSSSLQVNTATTKLRQQLFHTVHEKLYMLSMQVARPDADIGTIDVVMKIENSAGTVEYFSKTQTMAAIGSATDVFKPAYLFWYLDQQYDKNDVYIDIEINNFASSAAGPIYLDEVIVSAPVYHGGVNFSVLRGITEFEVGDRFNVNVTNNEAGVWQTYFRKAYRVQLPTATASSETIADTLAE